MNEERIPMAERVIRTYNMLEYSGNARVRIETRETEGYKAAFVSATFVFSSIEIKIDAGFAEKLAEIMRLNVVN